MVSNIALVLVEPQDWVPQQNVAVVGDDPSNIDPSSITPMATGA